MDKIQSLLKQMTIEEKAALVVGAGAWTTAPLDGLGVPPMMLTDGPHGVRRSSDLSTMASGSLPATCFPSTSCLASTWNTGLLRSMGQAMAEEAIALQVIDVSR